MRATLRRASLLLLLLLAGCSEIVHAPDDADPMEMYHLIAQSLPRADFGWGSPPGMVTLSASARRERAMPELRPLLAREEGFILHYTAYRPRSVWIPYTALREARWSWKPLPNAILAPLIFLPFQVSRATIVIDAREAHGLLQHLERDIQRLEQISREVGLGGPWSHAQDVKAKLAADRKAYGPGRISVHFDYLVPVPAAFPVAGEAEDVAEAYAWAQAHPEEPDIDQQDYEEWKQQRRSVPGGAVSAVVEDETGYE